MKIFTEEELFTIIDSLSAEAKASTKDDVKSELYRIAKKISEHLHSEV